MGELLSGLYEASPSLHPEHDTHDILDLMDAFLAVLLAEQPGPLNEVQRDLLKTMQRHMSEVRSQ